MTTITHTGAYEAHVQLPDGSVVLMQPGDTVTIPTAEQSSTGEGDEPPADQPTE